MSVELWLPGSWCDTGCLPPRRRAGLAGGVRVAGRLTAVVLVLAAAALLAPLLVAIGPARRSSVRRLLARALLAVLGVRHELRGRPPRHAALVVASHISWLDILVLLAYVPVRLVAKHQVRRWPLIGQLAASAGTVFVDRSRPRTLPATVAQITTALRSGQVVAAFPEGTTWCGRASGRFRPAMFQAAIDASAPVVPVSLRYRSVDGRATTVAAFLGEDTLIASLVRIAGARGLRVGVDVHATLYPGPGAARGVLSRAAHASVYRPDVQQHPAHR